MEILPDVVGVGVVACTDRRPGGTSRRGVELLPPDADLSDLGDLLPAEHGGVLLDPLLLGGEIRLRALPGLVVRLPLPNPHSRRRSWLSCNFPIGEHPNQSFYLI